LKIGIVLEGGGMRGIFSAGALQAFLQEHFMADEVVGVSAGASIGISYVSRQSDRGLRTTINYASDKKYLSLENYIKTGSLFGMDFIFSDIPEKLDPFDYDAFQKNPCEYYAGVTDVHTGETIYFGKKDIAPPYTVLRASCSMPVCAPIVHFQGGDYLDGGMRAPIPMQKALADGCDKLIVVLTRERGYQKKPQRGRLIYANKYHDYPAVVHLLDTRHKIYNSALQTLQNMEHRGNVIIAAPDKPLPMDRFGTKTNQLMASYRIGIEKGTEALKRAKNQWGLPLPNQYLPSKHSITVKIDRPLGSAHPEHPDMIYPVNYGYIPESLAPDGEEQDVYVLGVKEPVDSFTGELVAIIHRKDDIEDKWVAAPTNSKWTPEQIMKEVSFTEQYFDASVEML